MGLDCALVVGATVLISYFMHHIVKRKRYFMDHVCKSRHVMVTRLAKGFFTGSYY
jgi:hypothetical protein